jgi:hypothetical protein
VAAVIAAAAGAAPAWSVVSVISSFKVSGAGGPYALGVYRDSRYVYEIMYASPTPTLRRYTPAGKLLSVEVLNGVKVLRDAGRSDLGAGYFSALDADNGRLVTFTKAGSFVSAREVPRDARGYARRRGEREFYLGRGPYVYFYSVSGNVGSSFHAASYVNDLAVTDFFGGEAGGYVLVGYVRANEPVRVYTHSGSLVMYFSLSGVYNRGAECGRAVPARYRRSYWCNRRCADGTYAFQVDIGYTVAVAPASVGKIKAIYR